LTSVTSVAKGAATILLPLTLFTLKVKQFLLGSGSSTVVEHSAIDSEIKGSNHRHLSNIDCLKARTTCLVCFISTVNGYRKKRKRYLE
jgi:hypothetical protein